MALAVILRNSAKPGAIQHVLKLSSAAIRNNPIIKQSACISSICKTNSAGYLGISADNRILPKVQHLQVRKAHMDHGLLWTIEKAWAVSLLAIMPLTVLSPNTFMDDIFAITTIIHNHWGLEAIVIDYVRPVFFGETIPKIALLVCYVFSAAILGGLLYFNHNDIGIGRAINKFWHIRDGQTNE